MIEERTATINSRRVTVNNIRTIAKFCYDEYSRVLQSHGDEIKKGAISAYTPKPSVSFEVKTKDNVNYSSDSLDLFEGSGILDTKVLEEFSMRFSYSAKDAAIRVYIVDSQYTRYPSRFAVEGNDSTWVSGVFNKLQETINTWEKQESILRKFRWPISAILGMLAGYTLGWICTLPLPKPEGEGGVTVFIIVGVFTFNAVLWLLSDYLEKLWPNIEIVPALEHERKLDRRRKYLYYFISAILIPFVIAIIVNLLI